MFSVGRVQSGNYVLIPVGKVFPNRKQKRESFPNPGTFPSLIFHGKPARGIDVFPYVNRKAGDKLQKVELNLVSTSNGTARSSAMKVNNLLKRSSLNGNRMATGIPARLEIQACFVEAHYFYLRGGAVFLVEHDAQCTLRA